MPALASAHSTNTDVQSRRKSLFLQVLRPLHSDTKREVSPGPIQPLVPFQGTVGAACLLTTRSVIESGSLSRPPPTYGVNHGQHGYNHNDRSPERTPGGANRSSCASTYFPWHQRISGSRPTKSQTGPILQNMANRNSSAKYEACGRVLLVHATFGESYRMSGSGPQNGTGLQSSIILHQDPLLPAWLTCIFARFALLARETAVSVVHSISEPQRAAQRRSVFHTKRRFWTSGTDNSVFISYGDDKVADLSRHTWKQHGCQRGGESEYRVYIVVHSPSRALSLELGEQRGLSATSRRRCPARFPTCENSGATPAGNRTRFVFAEASNPIATPSRLLPVVQGRSLASIALAQDYEGGKICTPSCGSGTSEHSETAAVMYRHKIMKAGRSALQAVAVTHRTITTTLTLEPSSPTTVTADNQCVVDIGIFVHKTVESSLQMTRRDGSAHLITWISGNHHYVVELHHSMNKTPCRTRRSGNQWRFLKERIVSLILATLIENKIIHVCGATVSKRLARSPPTKANRVQSPAGSSDFRKWESCRTMPLVGGFSQGSPVYPAPSFRRRSIFTSITLIGPEDLVVKSHPNLLTSLHSIAFLAVSKIVKIGDCVLESDGRGGRIVWGRTSNIASSAGCDARQYGGLHRPTWRTNPTSSCQMPLRPNEENLSTHIFEVTHRQGRAQAFKSAQREQLLRMCGCNFSGPITAEDLLHQGVTVAERLICSPPTKGIRVQSPSGSLSIFACGNRGGRCRWSAGFFFSGISRFPCPFVPVLLHTHLNITLIGSEDLAVKRSHTPRAAQISPLPHRTNATTLTCPRQCCGNPRTPVAWHTLGGGLVLVVCVKGWGVLFARRWDSRGRLGAGS
ncbi:hypothetical protein PR048_027888 [Dryococelus australis]|uniref:Uncharacterized protein n=1 Tax=Dryococelus australis TaxID=614101 RepID=A0ABQ9GHQ5_9NEOP|nr:hypothetical protein PR048_027888 [Dryococelus australis]